jgi:hypothetical protein
MLPLKKPSNLIGESLSIKLLSMSEGLIGELSSILGKAADFAIRSGAERIDLKILKEIRWVPPSERR